jgi:outer membrane murein-binding lipoprotein Lpp
MSDFWGAMSGMNLWAMIVLTTLIGTVGSVITAAFRASSRHAKAKILASDGEVQRLGAVIASMNGDMDKMRDRLAVLERLVTDDDRRLSEEISRLRPRETTQTGA